MVTLRFHAYLDGEDIADKVRRSPPVPHYLTSEHTFQRRVGDRRDGMIPASPQAASGGHQHDLLCRGKHMSTVTLVRSS